MSSRAFQERLAKRLSQRLEAPMWQKEDNEYRGSPLSSSWPYCIRVSALAQIPHHEALLKEWAKQTYSSPKSDSLSRWWEFWYVGQRKSSKSKLLGQGGMKKVAGRRSEVKWLTTAYCPLLCTLLKQIGLFTANQMQGSPAAMHWDWIFVVQVVLFSVAFVLTLFS